MNKLKINVYMHCKKCIDELPKGQSPQSYRRYDIGWTKKGFQVWCTRHNANIINADFQGKKIKADMTCEDTE